MKDTLSDLISNPIAVITGVLASVAGALNLDVLLVVLDGLWASVGTLFTSMSIFAFTVAPNVGLSASVVGVLEAGAVLLAVMYTARRMFQVVDQIRSDM